MYLEQCVKWGHRQLIFDLRAVDVAGLPTLPSLLTNANESVEQLFSQLESSDNEGATTTLDLESVLHLFIHCPADY
jgi:hypothetical protein